MQNLSVRHRLRSELDVQLTESNVVDDEFNYLQSTSRIQSHIIENSQQSCDVSLIDDLKMLDHINHMNQSIESINIIAQTIEQNESKTYFQQKEKVYSQNKNKIDNNNFEDAFKIVNTEKSHNRNLRQRINSLYNYESKFTNKKLKHNDVKKDNNNFQAFYQNMNQKQKSLFQRTKKMNKDYGQKDINKIVYDKNERSNSFNNSVELADKLLQQKFSTLPTEIKDKIKRNLNSKFGSLNLSLKNDMIDGSQQNFVQSNFQGNNLTKKISNDMIANEAVSFIVPLKEDELNFLKVRQKFVSVNRQTHKISKSNKKSLIFNNNIHQGHEKNRQLLISGQFSKRRTQKSISKQKMFMLNSINCESQFQFDTPFDNYSSREKHNNHKKQQFFINDGKTNTNKLIEKRRQQFAEFFRHKQQNKQIQIKVNSQQNQNLLQVKKSNHKFQNQNVLKRISNSNALMQNHIKLQEQFNKSKVIKNYVEILSTVPKCKKCSTTFGALTLVNSKNVNFSCNQCDLKKKLQRSVSFFSSSSCESSRNNFQHSQRNSSQFNHPLIGVLFDLENKLQNQHEMKTYNSLLKQISNELQKIDQKRKALNLLLNQVECLKVNVQKNPKIIFEAKNELKKFLINNENEESKDLQKYLNILIPSFLPPQYFQQLDLWCKINTKKYTEYPGIDQKLQLLCPLYMKRYMKTMGQFINPLFHNFQTNNIKISVSQELKLPVKSLGKATFVVDGPYNISSFEQIQNLTLEFSNKRTFREIASVMQRLPQNVQSIQLTYDHKLNSHISAEKYPILTKIVSIRSCKQLQAQILNCKDEDDLISAFRVMTKKKKLKLSTTRSIYVRKPVINCSEQLKEMLRRLGKNICQIDLRLAVQFNEAEIYQQLMLTQRNKLMSFRLESTINQAQSPIKVQNHVQKKNKRKSLSQSLIVGRKQHMDSEDYAKRCFFHKLRKKVTAFALLKPIFCEKQSFQSKKDNIKNQEQRLIMENHLKSSHLLRLQVIKMLI